MGLAPVNPVVAKMLDRGGDYDRFVMPMLLTLRAGVEPDEVARTLQTVVDQHDVLRGRLEWAGQDGDSPMLRVDPVGSVDVRSWIRRVDLADIVPGSPEFAELASAELDSAIDRVDPRTSAAVQVVWFAPASDAVAGRLLIVPHHMVVDSVSWQILVPDFVIAGAQIASGQQPQLQPVGTSMRRWAHGQVEAAQAPERAAELGHWRRTLTGPDPLLGTRALDLETDQVRTLDRMEVHLPRELTESLVERIPAATGVDTSDVLVGTLALALAQWRSARGIDETAALLTLEGHGREESVVPGADLSRTVGWFTSMYPARVDVRDVDLDAAFAGGPATLDAIRSVKADLAATPDRGIGYGMLRYLNPQAAEQMREWDEPQIVFNYLGRIGGAEGGSDAGSTAAATDVGWLPAAEELDPTYSSEMPAQAVLDIQSMVQDTEIGRQYSAFVSFVPEILGRADVTELMDLWAQAISAVALAAEPRSDGSAG